MPDLEETFLALRELYPELDFQQLRVRLKMFKEGTNFLLRVDRRLPVRALEWVQHAFAIAKHDRMFYAVLPSKGLPLKGDEVNKQRA